MDARQWHIKGTEDEDGYWLSVRDPADLGLAVIVQARYHRPRAMIGGRLRPYRGPVKARVGRRVIWTGQIDYEGTTKLERALPVAGDVVAAVLARHPDDSALRRRVEAAMEAARVALADMDGAKAAR